MTCLACGRRNEYGAAACSACRRAFPVFPPFVKANHVAQLQDAVRACREGRISLGEFGEVYGRFAELAMSFQERWSLVDGPALSSRLPSSLEAFSEGMRELERGFKSLDLALGCVDEALETGDLEPLGPADEHLLDFFKICCGGCSMLMEELEKSGPEERSGTFLDSVS